MKSFQLFIICILLHLSVFGQTRTVRGIVYDRQNRNHIEGVSITPDFFENDSTDERGRFKVYYPRRYKDTIRFSHPEYYTYLTIIKDSKPKFIYLTPRSIPIDTIFHEVFNDNIVITGKVFDSVTKSVLKYARISLMNEQIIGYSNERGEFEIVIPSETNFIWVSDSFHVAKKVFTNSKSLTRPLRIHLNSIEHSSVNQYQDNYYKNVITWAPFELVNGAVAFSYERFIEKKQSVGIHTSLYIFGRNSNFFDMGYNENRFKGVKLAPFYRYYLRGIKIRGIYIEGKIPVGYFNFSELFYAWLNYDTSQGIDIEQSFWSAGVSASVGVSFNFPRSKHVVAYISIGLQYFPMNVAETIYASDYQGEMRKYYLQPNWWYISGPGSILEFKFLVGGIF